MLTKELRTGRHQSVETAPEPLDFMALMGKIFESGQSGLPDAALCDISLVK